MTRAEPPVTAALQTELYDEPLADPSTVPTFLVSRMAREHVNPINNLVTFVRHYFDDVGEQWLPARLPSIDLNLFYICHARV